MPTLDRTRNAERALEELRALAASDPAAAATRAWQWLTAIDATEEPALLADVFARGPASTDLDGDMEGQVLGLFGTAFLGVVDVLVRAGRLLGGIGWTGKTFDAEAGTGHNRLTWTARVPMFLAMPRYGFSRRGGELIGFRFDHRVEPSRLDPVRRVHAIIYDNPAHANPLMLPRTRDELVEVVPGVHLGRALLRDEGGWQVVAYFALRDPAHR